MSTTTSSNSQVKTVMVDGDNKIVFPDASTFMHSNGIESTKGIYFTTYIHSLGDIELRIYDLNGGLVYWYASDYCQHKLLCKSNECKAANLYDIPPIDPDFPYIVINNNTTYKDVYMAHPAHDIGATLLYTFPSNINNANSGAIYPNISDGESQIVTPTTWTQYPVWNYLAPVYWGGDYDEAPEDIRYGIGENIVSQFDGSEFYAGMCTLAHSRIILIPSSSHQDRLKSLISGLYIPKYSMAMMGDRIYTDEGNFMATRKINETSFLPSFSYPNWLSECDFQIYNIPKISSVS